MAFPAAATCQSADFQADTESQEQTQTALIFLS